MTESWVRAHDTTVKTDQPRRFCPQDFRLTHGSPANRAFQFVAIMGAINCMSPHACRSRTYAYGPGFVRAEHETKVLHALLGRSQLRTRASTLRARSARDQVRKSPSTSATYIAAKREFETCIRFLESVIFYRIRMVKLSSASVGEFRLYWAAP